MEVLRLKAERPVGILLQATDELFYQFLHISEM